jgi:hypothetical protein
MLRYSVVCESEIIGCEFKDNFSSAGFYQGGDVYQGRAHCQSCLGGSAFLRVCACRDETEKERQCGGPSHNVGFIIGVTIETRVRCMTSDADVES